MIKSKFILLAFFSFALLQLQAQSIELEFPHFAHQGWWFRVFQGEKMDTIAKGALDENGRATIRLPEEYRNFRGMSQWILTKGGGLDMVIGSYEDFSVSCFEAQPSGESIKYKASAENDYLLNRFIKQQAVFQKIDIMRMALDAYVDELDAFNYFSEELTKQELVYGELQKETKQNKLYAARFSEIVDLTRGYSKSISRDVSISNNELRNYIVHEMNLADLYTSGHWTTVTSMWLESYSQVDADEETIDKLVISDYNAMLQSTDNVSVRQDFEKTIRFLLQNNGKEPLSKQIGVVGVRAPDFAITESNMLSDIKGKRLLFFYGSFCDLCQNELQELTKNYRELSESGVTIIGVDSEPSKAATRPWSYVVSDRKFEVFWKYHVEQSPVYVLIDEDGKVVSKETSLQKVLKQ